MAFWKKLFGGHTSDSRDQSRVTGPRATAVGASSERASGETIAHPSKVLPSFPLNPMYHFIKGAPIDGQRLADVSTVGLCVCVEFERWKAKCGRDWPTYADGELAALKRAYLAMQVKAARRGTTHDIDTGRVAELASMYLSTVKENPAAYKEFLGAHLTLLNLTIDFGNTIGYGGVLQAALDWYEQTGYA